jgi:hypothetical protein
VSARAAHTIEAARDRANQSKVVRKRLRLSRALPDVDDSSAMRSRLKTVSASLQGKDLGELPSVDGIHALSSAVLELDGGRDRFIEFVQYAAQNREPVAQHFYAVYSRLSVDERRTVSFDDVCVVAKIRPVELLAVVTIYAREFNHQMGSMIAAFAHPDIVRQAARSAMRIGGGAAATAQRDREMLFQHSGFTPIPKSTVVTVNASATAGAAAQSSPQAAEHDVPSFSVTMTRARSRPPGQLPAGGSTGEQIATTTDLPIIEAVPVERS